MGELENEEKDSLRPQVAEGINATVDEKTGSEEQHAARRRKTLFGVLIVILIAFSWVSSTQFAKSTYSTTFNAPYFTTWFSTCWVIILFPMCCLPYCVVKRISFGQLFRTSAEIFGSRGLSLVTLSTHVLPFCLLWMATNYSYIRALGAIDAADVTAVFSSASAFVYVFSLLWLDERISVLKVTAVCLSIGGIVLMAYSEGFKGPNAVGIILSLAAAIGAALYKVLFKKVVGNATASQVSLFLTCLGLLSTTLLWPVILLVYFTKYEVIEWNHIPWSYLCGTASLNLVFNYFINFGIAFTYPLFISLGIVLGIPLNALTDAVFRGNDFGILKIVAAALIVIGFSFMLIPKRFEKKLQNKLCCNDTPKETVDNEGELLSST